MTIGELARRAGLKPSAIRYYESAGVLPPPARRNGRRIYEDEALDRLAFALFARRMGYSVAEVAALAAARGSGRPFSKRMRALAGRKIEELDRWIAEAQRMRVVLTDSLDCHCPDLATCGRRQRAARTPAPPVPPAPARPARSRN